MYSMGPQSEGEIHTLLCNQTVVCCLIANLCVVLLEWQVTTWVERPTGPEASTSTLLSHSDQAREALETSLEHTSSSMPETCVT